jgi:hypothetical protein
MNFVSSRPQLLKVRQGREQHDDVEDGGEDVSQEYLGHGKVGLVTQLLRGQVVDKQQRLDGIW